MNKQGEAQQVSDNLLLFPSNKIVYFDKKGKPSINEVALSLLINNSKAIEGIKDELPVNVISILGPSSNEKFILTKSFVEYYEHGMNGTPFLTEEFQPKQKDSETSGIYLLTKPFTVHQDNMKRLVWILYIYNKNGTDEEIQFLQQFMLLACSRIAEVKMDKKPFPLIQQWSKLEGTRQQHCNDFIYIFPSNSPFLGDTQESTKLALDREGTQKLRVEMDKSKYDNLEVIEKIPRVTVIEMRSLKRPLYSNFCQNEAHEQAVTKSLKGCLKEIHRNFNLGGSQVDKDVKELQLGNLFNFLKECATSASYYIPCNPPLAIVKRLKDFPEELKAIAPTSMPTQPDGKGSEISSKRSKFNETEQSRRISQNMSKNMTPHVSSAQNPHMSTIPTTSQPLVPTIPPIHPSGMITEGTTPEGTDLSNIGGGCSNENTNVSSDTIIENNEANSPNVTKPTMLNNLSTGELQTYGNPDTNAEQPELEEAGRKKEDETKSTKTENHDDSSEGDQHGPEATVVEKQEGTNGEETTDGATPEDANGAKSTESKNVANGPEDQTPHDQKPVLAGIRDPQAEDPNDEKTPDAVVGEDTDLDQEDDEQPDVESIQVEQAVANKLIPEMVGFYKEEMRQFLAEDLYDPHVLQDIHENIKSTLSANFARLFRVNEHQKGVIEAELSSLLDENFPRYSQRNSENWKMKQAKISKCLQKMMSSYMEQIENVLSENPNGLKQQELESKRDEIVKGVEAKLETEIWANVRGEEPMKGHHGSLMAEISDYWDCVVERNSENLEKMQATEVQNTHL